ncbi:unnamed protein product [Anisakis simplex]|uniref:Zinc finger protein LEE1 n=1 Tax=Anisakis simplex TaxID=6269 RepID=A0A0M3K2Q2_ANISI|nr:unnamed protein product [Anisakis simplex]
MTIVDCDDNVKKDFDRSRILDDENGRVLKFTEDQLQFQASHAICDISNDNGTAMALSSSNSERCSTDESTWSSQLTPPDNSDTQYDDQGVNEILQQTAIALLALDDEKPKRWTMDVAKISHDESGNFNEDKHACCLQALPQNTSGHNMMNVNPISDSARSFGTPHQTGITHSSSTLPFPPTVFATDVASMPPSAPISSSSCSTNNTPRNSTDAAVISQQKQSSSIKRASSRQLSSSSSSSSASGLKSPKPDTYKTVMCQAWLENNKCNFAENCRFAHGEEELRPCKTQVKNAKYRTKLCEKYTLVGLCPYGNRCLFVHPDSDGQNAYIRPDRLEKMEHERHLFSTAWQHQNSNAPDFNANHAISPLTFKPYTPPNHHLSVSPFLSYPPPSFNPFQNTRLAAYPNQSLGDLAFKIRRPPPPSWPLEPEVFFDHFTGDSDGSPDGSSSQERPQLFDRISNTYDAILPVAEATGSFSRSLLLSRANSATSTFSAVSRSSSCSIGTFNSSESDDTAEQHLFTSLGDINNLHYQPEMFPFKRTEETKSESNNSDDKVLELEASRDSRSQTQTTGWFSQKSLLTENDDEGVRKASLSTTTTTTMAATAPFKRIDSRVEGQSVQVVDDPFRLAIQNDNLARHLAASIF